MICYFKIGDDMKLVNYPENASFFFSHDIKNEDSGEWTMQRHYHDLFEIYYLEKGSCNYFIDNKSYQLLEGDIAIIPAGVIHNTLYKNSKYSRMLINCTSRYIPASVISRFKKLTYIYRNKDASKKIYELLKEIEAEFKRGGELSDDILSCLTGMLFFTMLRNQNSYDDKQIKNEYVEKAVNFVQKNYTEQLSLTETAKMFSLSPEHFSREFKKETGFGFCEYVSILRLKRAEQLLKENEKISVTEVSERCGFNDSNYFSIRFKKMFGVSPKKIQKKSKN